MMTPMASPVLDIIKPLNEPRRKNPLYMAKFFIDEKKYYYEIYFLSIIFFIVTMYIIATTDCIIANIYQHCEGLINILRYF